MKKGIVLLLVLSLLFTSVGCSKDNTNNEVESQGKNEVENQSKGDSIEVDKKLTNVEVTIPASFFELDGEEELDIEQITKDAKEEGVKEVKLNDDGSVTYTMSKDTHKKLLDDMKNAMLDSFDELINDEDISSIKDIKSNKTYSEFDIVVNKDEFENSFDGFAVLGIVFQSMFYQLFEGVEPDNNKVIVNFKDADTEEIFNSITYPDAFNQ
ncbi:hypothetical protein [Paratissierella segnis]|uniref:Antigen I/II N-terminal domain-containing protein n=1 Tax=Paratissierella segnis TaxID=2763679 RepID=A0A926EW13_9FIRM|nr:hypothetical protein [Paratissierella segnis]MBC8589343.1 hypothetical protein [Paratissierella segnis]